MLTTTLLLPSLFAAAVLAQEAPPTIYAPPAIPREGEADDMAWRLDLRAGWATDYVFRGIEILESPGSEDAANGQVFAKLGLDLGEAPSPFVGLFVNAAEDDPVSDFQTLQPTAGADWQLGPALVSFGYAAYLYPDRDELNTQEAFVGVEFTGDPDGFQDYPLRPFVLGVYDFDLYDGFYGEAGLRYVQDIEQTGLTVTWEAAAAYAGDYGLLAGPVGDDSGFAHYRLGMIAAYELNELLNIPRRYGTFYLRGDVGYVDGIDNDLRADSELFGGASVGIRF